MEKKHSALVVLKDVVFAGFCFYIAIKIFIYLFHDGPAKTVESFRSDIEEYTPPAIQHYEAFDFLNAYSPSKDKGKEVTVNGSVYKIARDVNGSVYVLLGDSRKRYSPNKYVECYLSVYNTVNPSLLDNGDYIQIQGECGSIYRGNVIMSACRINPL